MNNIDCIDYGYDLCKYQKNIYSWYGENGIIDRLLELYFPDTISGWCCELGAWDGKKYSNTFHLIEKGWAGVYIESDPDKFVQLKETAKDYPRLVVFNVFVKNQLDEILRRAGTPKKLMVLSIDTDTCDYEIWDSLKEYRPQIVIIEDGGQAGERRLLGESKGYELVVYTGSLIFVERDCLK